MYSFPALVIVHRSFIIKECVYVIVVVLLITLFYTR